MLRANPGAAIVYDLISSRVVPERVKELGGKPVVSKVGYTFFCDVMTEARALFGAETAGHTYFRVSDNYYTESAAYAYIILHKFLQKREQKLSELVAPLANRYVQSGEVNLDVGNMDGAIQAVKNKFQDGKMEHIDGISISFDEFWFNLRPSNTEPVLRLRLEGINRDIVDSKCEQIKKIIASY